MVTNPPGLGPLQASGPEAALHVGASAQAPRDAAALAIAQAPIGYPQ